MAQIKQAKFLISDSSGNFKMTLTTKTFLRLHKILTYLKATADTRCVVEYFHLFFEKMFS
jgi:hypothetical protein